MCFSAAASFGASAMLGVVGVLAVRRTTSSSQLLFAGIPLIFAAQQFTEGLVWLSLTDPHYEPWQFRSIHSFLFFAQILWPVWSPLSMFRLEEDPRRKKQLRALTVIGILVSLCLAYYLMFTPVHAEILSHHIRYDENFPMVNLWFGSILYFIPTALPFFISSLKGTRLMGLSLLASYLITQFFFAEFLTSVWCFFAAVLSIQALLLITQSQKSTARQKALRYTQ